MSLWGAAEGVLSALVEVWVETVRVVRLGFDHPGLCRSLHVFMWKGTRRGHERHCALDYVGKNGSEGAEFADTTPFVGPWRSSCYLMVS